MKSKELHILTDYERDTIHGDPGAYRYKVEFRAYYIIHEKDTHANKNVGDMLFVNKKRGHVFCCCICKVLSGNSFHHGTGSGLLHSTDTYFLDNKYYVVPESHTRCRELFELNPLGYAYWKTSWVNMVMDVVIQKHLMNVNTDLQQLLYDKVLQNDKWDWELERQFDVNRMLQNVYR